MPGRSRKTPLPTVAIVGRPNVGKSTLFNRLVGSRIALVDDMPGVTRDRNYALMEWRGKTWTVVDTGGFEPETEDDILAAMKEQTELAISEADAIIFLLDGKAGLLPGDHEVAKVLRRSRKPVFYTVNKVDGPSHEPKVHDFYPLGVNQFFGVSAEHGYGVDELLDALREAVPGAGPEPTDPEAEEEFIPRVAVVGRPNVGKSTLINALLGQPRHLVHESPGTTRDAVDCEVIINGRAYTFIDTAGLRKKSRINTRLERFSVMRAIRSLARCHAALVMVDATEGIVDQEAKIAGLAHERGRAMILLFNKWDLVADKEKRRQELELEIQTRLPHVTYAPVLTISAQQGIRIGKLGAALDEVINQFNHRVGTGELNRALEEWTKTHHPPSPDGEAVKFYYAAQTGVRPPTFVFFVNRPHQVPVAYQRYLVNQLRLTFGFEGTPLRVLLRPRKRNK